MADPRSFQFRFESEDQKKAAMEKAKADVRSLNGYILQLIKRDLEKAS